MFVTNKGQLGKDLVKIEEWGEIIVGALWGLKAYGIRPGGNISIFSHCS